MEQSKIFRIVILVCGFTSLCSAGYIINRFHRQKSSQRNILSKLVCCLCYSDSLYVLVQFYFIIINWCFSINWKENDLSSGTVIQAYIQQACNLNQFALIVLIAYSLQKTIIDNEDLDEKIQNPLKHFSLLLFVIPILVSLIPIGTMNYRSQFPDPQTLSSISLNTSEKWQRVMGVVELVVLETIPFFISLTYVTVAITKIFMRIKEIEKEILINQEIRRHVKGTLLFPLALAIIWMPIMVTHIISFFNPSTYKPLPPNYQMNNVEFGLSLTAQSLVTFQGFINSLIYRVFNLQSDKQDEIKKFNSPQQIVLRGEEQKSKSANSGNNYYDSLLSGESISQPTTENDNESEYQSRKKLDSIASSISQQSIQSLMALHKFVHRSGPNTQ